MSQNQTVTIMNEQSYSNLDRKKIIEEVQQTLLRFENPGPFRGDGLALYLSLCDILEEERSSEDE